MLNNKLFNFKIKPNLKINVSKNEIYNQLLLYMFYQSKKNVLIVVQNYSEVSYLYRELKNYIKDIYAFPDDDYITKKAIASSPELLLMRMELFNNISSLDKKVVIIQLNSFLRKYSSPNIFKSKQIIIQKDDIFSRDELIKKLYDIGYKMESIVTTTGEFSVRGFVVDVFPIQSEKPIRIEFFDDKIEEIKYFNEQTQLSTSNLINFVINPIKDEFGNDNYKITDYFQDYIIIYENYLQLINQENLIMKQITAFNEDVNGIFRLKNFNNDNNIFIDIVNNFGEYDYKFISEDTFKNYDNEKTKYEFLNKDNAFLCTTDKNFIKKFDNNINIINENINNGFIYNNNIFYSKNDFEPNKIKTEKINSFKFGKKITNLDKLKEGDYVVYYSCGIGIYRGITTIEKNNIKRDYILIEYKGNDKLYLTLDNIDKLYKYSSKDTAKPIINKLNGVEWKKTKKRLKEKIVQIRNELIEIYKKRNESKIQPFEKDNEIQTLFENDFEYEPTLDQIKCVEEIKKDLESSKPMDRLLCGDVGYGKTEVIFRIMFKTVLNNKQVLYMCPTTLLSSQQYNLALKRFIKYGVNIAILNRHTSQKVEKQALKNLEEGKIDILFGTHRLLSDDIKPKNLGLFVIDEEQRFGVMYKEKIKKMKSNVHILSVSATPIPRTLQMSLTGIRDLSLITTAPKDRVPVQTYVIYYDDIIIRSIILKEIERGGQIFIVYNKVENIDVFTNKIHGIVPEINITYAHGQMEKNKIQRTIEDFIDKKYDCLVSTTIIENGIDIPNANTIIIIDADKFGLSQLYQMRGRVGRGTNIGYAYLMYDKYKILNETAQKRLETIKEFTDLGSGYKIAYRDLSIRGAGDLLGKEQAGFIDSIGVNMYLDIINGTLTDDDLDDDIQEKEDSVYQILDVDKHVDNNYTNIDELKIELHQKINSVKSNKGLNDLINEIKDRFGFIDDKLINYIHNEYLENLLSELNIPIFMNDNYKIIILIEKNIYEKLNIEELFITATQINNKFSFQYKNEKIFIKLIKNNLDKLYIYYLLELIEAIKKDLKN